MGTERGPLLVAGRHQELLTKQRVFCKKLAAGAEHIAQQATSDRCRAQGFPDRPLGPGHGVADTGPYPSFEYCEKHGAVLLDILLES